MWFHTCRKNFSWQFCDCDLFGMVKTWPLQMVKWPPTIGDEKVTAWITWKGVLFHSTKPTTIPPSLQQDETLGSDSIFQFIWRNLTDLPVPKKTWYVFFPGKKHMCQVLPSDPFFLGGGVKWPFQGLSDLHLGHQKGHLEEADGLKSCLALLFLMSRLWIFLPFNRRYRKVWKFTLPKKLRLSGWCSTPNQLLICSSFSRKNGNPLLICSSLSTNQLCTCGCSLQKWNLI